MPALAKACSAEGLSTVLMRRKKKNSNYYLCSPEVSFKKHRETSLHLLTSPYSVFTERYVGSLFIESPQGVVYFPNQ